MRAECLDYNDGEQRFQLFRKTRVGLHFLIDGVLDRSLVRFGVFLEALGVLGLGRVGLEPLHDFLKELRGSATCGWARRARRTTAETQTSITTSTAMPATPATIGVFACLTTMPMYAQTMTRV